MQIIIVILAIFALLNVTESRRRFDIMGAVNTVGNIANKVSKIAKIITHRRRLY